eukprot:gene19541-biopygen23152
MPSTGYDRANTLRVMSKTQHKEYAGLWDLVRSQRANGMPLWKQRGEDRWLYSGIDRYWYFMFAGFPGIGAGRTFNATV